MLIFSEIEKKVGEVDGYDFLSESKVNKRGGGGTVGDLA